MEKIAPKNQRVGGEKSTRELSVAQSVLCIANVAGLKEEMLADLLILFDLTAADNVCSRRIRLAAYVTRLERVRGSRPSWVQIPHPPPEKISGFRTRCGARDFFVCRRWACGCSSTPLLRILSQKACRIVHRFESKFCPWREKGNLRTMNL